MQPAGLLAAAKSHRVAVSLAVDRDGGGGADRNLERGGVVEPAEDAQPLAAADGDGVAGADGEERRLAGSWQPVTSKSTSQSMSYVELAAVR